MKIPDFSYIFVDSWKAPNNANTIFPCDDWVKAEFRIHTPKTHSDVAVNVVIKGKAPVKKGDDFFLRIKIMFLDEDGDVKSTSLGWLLLRTLRSNGEMGSIWCECNVRNGNKDIPSGFYISDKAKEDLLKFTNFWLSKYDGK